MTINVVVVEGYIFYTVALSGGIILLLVFIVGKFLTK